MRIYQAGPLFSQGEQIFNRMVAAELEEHEHQVFLPQEAVEQVTDKPGETTRIFRQDVDGLTWAEAVVAVLDGPDVDSGTAWEIGYANAKGKPIFGLRTDLRAFGPQEKVNLMIQESCQFIAGSISELVFRMKTWTP